MPMRGAIYTASDSNYRIALIFMVIMIALVCAMWQPATAMAAQSAALDRAASPASPPAKPGASNGTEAPASSVPAVSAVPVEVSELWVGSLYASSFRVGVCFSSLGDVRGVVLLQVPSGKVDVYHITGSVNGNTVEASHRAGHKFKGRLVSSDKVEGVITLRNGMKISLEGVRTHDATLTDTCRPLPE